MGVASHPRKRMDEQFNAEILGFLTKPDGKIQPSADRCLPLICACIKCALWLRPPRNPYERTIGKIGHARMLRPCLSSSFSAVYRIVVEGRQSDTPQLLNTLDSVLEMLRAAVLLPPSYMDRGLPWLTRVVATDAATVLAWGGLVAAACALLRPVLFLRFLVVTELFSSSMALPPEVSVF